MSPPESLDGDINMQMTSAFMYRLNTAVLRYQFGASISQARKLIS